MDALTRELRRQLSALDPAPAPRPKREPRAGLRPWAHLETLEA